MPDLPGLTNRGSNGYAQTHESLAELIQDAANQFGNAASVLSEQYTILDNATNGLLDGICPWVGLGAEGFLNAWQSFGQYIQQLEQSCTDTQTALHKMSNKIAAAENQEGWNLLLTIVGGLITVVSFAAAISEFGLDPLADGFLAFIATFTRQESANVANVATDITEADTEATSELQQVEEELTNSPGMNTMSGNVSGSSSGLPQGISPVNLDEMLPDSSSPDEFFARGGKQFNFKNDAYFNDKPGMDQMPPGLNDPEAQYWIKQIESKGVRVVWDHDIQVELLNRKAYGITLNPVNYKLGPDASPEYMLVGLSPDADATTVYEEYLHVTEAESRGWLPYTDEATAAIENYEEEIQVEYQVMQNAQQLGTTQKMWNILSANRKYHIQQLLEKLGNNPVPANIQQYFQDPPMPPSFPG